jgi:hypothetical protein
MLPFTPYLLFLCGRWGADGTGSVCYGSTNYSTEIIFGWEIVTNNDNKKKNQMMTLIII